MVSSNEPSEVCICEESRESSETSKLIGTSMLIQVKHSRV